MRALSILALGALLVAACDGQQHPWTEASQTIAVSAFSPFEGLWGLERDRSQLTAEQLDRLERLVLREPEPGCGTDQLGYWITITDATGGTHEYHATQYDQQCGEPDPFVSMGSLHAFLATFACISSRGTTPEPEVIHPGDGCRHGFYMDGRGTAVRAALAVDAAGTLTVEVEAGATFAPHVTLLDVDGATTLGDGAAALTWTFTAAGTYFLEVSSTNDAHGDLLVRVR